MKPFSFFNPKGSLFSICYYKQDLHYWRFHSCLHKKNFYIINTSPYKTKVIHERVLSLSFPLFDKYKYNKNRLSAIHFQNSCIRLVGCYTIFNGCQLPWLPSNCHNATIFFMGSDERLFWHFNLIVRFIPHSQLCLPKTAHFNRLLFSKKISIKQIFFLTHLKFENKLNLLQI